MTAVMQMGTTAWLQTQMARQLMMVQKLWALQAHRRNHKPCNLKTCHRKKRLATRTMQTHREIDRRSHTKHQLPYRLCPEVIELALCLALLLNSSSLMSKLAINVFNSVASHEVMQSALCCCQVVNHDLQTCQLSSNTCIQQPCLTPSSPVLAPSVACVLMSSLP